MIKKKLVFKLIKLTLDVYQHQKDENYLNFEKLVTKCPLSFLSSVFILKNPQLINTNKGSNPTENYLEFYYALHTNEPLYINFNERNEKELIGYFEKLSKFMCIFSQIDPAPFFARYKKYKDEVIKYFIITLVEKSTQINNINGVKEELRFFLKTNLINWEIIENENNTNLIKEATNNFKDRKLLLSG